MAVYDSFYRFSTPAFALSPDPAFLFLSRGHREALAGLKYAIQDKKGFAVLTGEVGTGKTTLVHALLRDLGDNVRTALFVNPYLSQVDLYQHLLAEFRLPAEETMTGSTRALQRFLIDQFTLGIQVVVIIDEAHALPRRIMEEVRLLSNFETSKSKLLQIVLVGQPELVERLRRPAFRQLRQRIALGFELLPLAFEETIAYVRRRLRVAGGAEEIFKAGAFVPLHRFSGGLPRVLNLLCDHTLVKGFARDLKVIDAGVVRDAARELNLRPLTRVGWWHRLRARRSLRTPVAAGGGSKVALPLAGARK
jgi:general secretion pathway protein A